jgi:hypothetical protein
MNFAAAGKSAKKRTTVHATSVYQEQQRANSGAGFVTITYPALAARAYRCTLARSAPAHAVPASF